MGSNLAEGIPAIVDELAYKLILELSKDAGTSNWLAYKYFLDGCKLFSDFEKNRTRIDLLRDSISIWRESVKSDPEFAKAHYNLGVANDWDGNIEDALFRYQKAISLNPELIGAAAHFNIARLFWENYKDETRTLSELEKAKQINPNIPEIYNLEGLAYSNKKESYSKEAELYQKAIDLNKENAPPVFYSNLCIAKFYLNQLEDAQAAGEKSYQFYGEKEKFIGLLETMAKIHYQKGENSEKFKNSTIAKIEFEKSVKYYKEVLLKDPENKGLLSGYGNALIKLNSYNYAMQIFRRVIRIYPEDPMAYQKIAECLVAQKQKLDEAEIYLQVSDILLKNGTELLKLKEALVKDYESLQQTKLCKGILACILNVFCDSNKNPDLFNDSIAIFNEIFQPLYDNTKSMIDAELLNHFAQALFKVNNYEETINRINHTILIYNNDENDERFFDLAKAYSDLANGYTNLIQKLFNEFRHNEYLESILKEKARMIPTDEVKKELMEATKKADESYRVIGNIFLDADMAFQNASYNYQNAGYLKQAVEAHLNNAEFLLKKESYQIKRDKVYTVARIECDKAIKIDNKDFSTFLVKGTTYYSSRQYAKAIPEYEKSVELNFSQKATHYNIGLCFYYMGEYEKASKAFQTVLKLDPKYTSPDDMNSPDAYQILAMSLEKLGDMNGEVKILRDAVNVHPDKVKYHILLGKSLKRKNDLDEAAEEFRTALNLDKINFQKMRHIALTELADIYADNGADINSAEIYISEAKDIIEQLDPEEKEKIISQMENTAGWIYFNLNRYELAIKLLEKTLSKFLNEPKFHSRLAVAYENYANSLSDLKLKKEYINKSGTQWEIISNLKGNDRYKKMADEHLANLTKL